MGIGWLVVLHIFRNKPAPSPTSSAAETTTIPSPSPAIAWHVKPEPKTASSDDDVTEMIPTPPVDAGRVAECLAGHPRDAANLLAAFHLAKDTNYLNEAVANFPDDPRVQFAVLAKNAFPADRRKWLDRFKASAPDNALADYLSAQDYFERGNTNAAINELLAADGKKQFGTYAVDSQLDREQMALCAGKSISDAGRIAMENDEHIPMLAGYRKLVQHMDDLQKQYAAAGDKESAENMTLAELNFARQVGSGDSGKYLVNQLVGLAIQSMALRGLDQDRHYEFLDDETPAAALKDLKTQRSEWSKTVKSFMALYPQFTDAELVSYQERMRLYGEIDAMRWLLAQHPQDQQP